MMKNMKWNPLNSKIVSNALLLFFKGIPVMLPKILFALVLCILLPKSVLAQGSNQPAEQETQWISTSFPRFFYDEKVPLQWDFPYCDSYFSQPATTYNHELAKSSMGLAVSAFRKRDASLENMDQNVRNFLTTAGFRQLTSEDYDASPRIDTIATIIGAKALGDSTLISVAISGADYQEEWKSNATISAPQQDGDDVFHYGFSNAADTVFCRILNYIDENNIDGTIKIWITGFSRAAAVGNLTGLKLLKAGTVTDENLYAYTFAAPRCAKGVIDWECPSIFNIVGSVDSVPSTPFFEWGYDRYGTTLYLPAQELCCDYAQRKAAAEPIYLQLTGTAFMNNPFANWIVHKGMQTFGEVVTESNYGDLLQQSVLETMDMTSSYPVRIWSFFKLVNSNPELREKVFATVSNTKELYSVIAYHIVHPKMGLESNPWQNDTFFYKELMREHYHETYIAWLFSQESPEDLYIDNLCYRQFIVTGDVWVTVTDRQGKSLIDLPSFPLGDSRLITIPADGDYTLTMTARSDTKLQFVMTERLSQHLYERLITWNPSDGVMQAAGSVLTLSLPRGSGVPSSAFVLEGSDKWTLVQDMDLSSIHTAAEVRYSGDAARYFLIRVMWYIIIAVALLILFLIWLYVCIDRKRKKKKSAAMQYFPK